MEKFNGINSVIKPKRKELDDFNNDFSDFSMLSPARKIRRLDVELSPIVEEEGTDFPMRYEQVIPENVILNEVGDQFKLPDIEDLVPAPENEERAIVLFKPVDAPISFSGSQFSVDPSLIASFKNQALWRVNPKAIEQNGQDKDLTDEDYGETSSCRAVIPWAPPQQLNFKPEVTASKMEMSDAMDTEEPEVTTMEIEDSGDPYRRSWLTEGLSSQWQQPNCTFPQPLENSTTPVVWYR